MSKRRKKVNSAGLRYTVEANLVVAYRDDIEVGREAWCKPGYSKINEGGWVNSQKMTEAAARLREKIDVTRKGD